MARIDRSSCSLFSVKIKASTDNETETGFEAAPRTDPYRNCYASLQRKGFTAARMHQSDEAQLFEQLMTVIGGKHASCGVRLRK